MRAGRPAPKPPTQARPRLRIFLWAALLGLIFGVIGFGEPVDETLRITRNIVRAQEASQNLVILAVDDRSLSQHPGWPWPRAEQARIIDSLGKGGARRIIFDIALSERTKRFDDRQLAKSIAASPSEIVLPSQFRVDEDSGRRKDILPLPDFRAHATIGNINFRYDRNGSVWRLPYAVETPVGVTPSLAATVTGVAGEPESSFLVDYSINPRSIPVVSAVDVLNGTAPKDVFRGKDVLLGTTSQQLEDLFFVPGHGRMSGVYIHALGVETLNRRVPTDLGWLPVFALSFLLAALIIWSRNAVLAAAAFVASLALVLGLPLFSEANGIFLDSSTAAFVLIFVAFRSGLLRFKEAQARKSEFNPVSGLPNLLRFTSQDHIEPRPIVVARVRNFAEICAVLSDDGELALVRSLVRRLQVGEPAGELYQGDQGVFAWVAPSAGNELYQHLDTLGALLQAPLPVEGSDIDLAVTFGLDMSRRPISNRVASALVAADEAAAEMRQWKVFDASSLEDAPWRLSLVGQLDGAIDMGDVWIAYQPKVDLASRHTVGVEALARWNHHEKGAVSPLEFIRAAERSGRIERLTYFVLDRSLDELSGLLRGADPFTLAVNLSAQLVDGHGLITSVSDLLSKYGVAPDRLTLEVTETEAMARGVDMHTLHELRRLGVRISIDDYGTGHSTLGYLRSIPAEEIKIDRSFIQSLRTNPEDRLMVESTIRLAHSLDRVVVAEGIEDEETLDLLATMGCDLGQGYLLGRPMPIEELLKFAQARSGSRAA
ncbi:MAG TPA: EAL domain-containing protein [Allosphingosinicella sp.]|jgi:EAL domain-containing protein (putative c-di-GMP-specific phosphodiesterase class I)/CHASE2 domain-containing sensor protein